MNTQAEEVAEQNAYGEFENIPEDGAAEALVEEAAGYGEAAPANANGANGVNNSSNSMNVANANASANNGTSNSVAAGRVRTAAEQRQLNERQAMHSEMVEAFKQAFGDNAKAPKPAFTAAGTMLKIRKQEGENAYEQAMSNYLARAQNKYYGYSKRGATAKVRAAQPARYNTSEIVGSIRQGKTRKNVIHALEAALEALRLENGAAAPAVSPRPVAEAPAAAAPKSKARKTAKKAASTAAKSKSRSRSASSAKKHAAAKPAATGQVAISVARAALAAAAGVKIPQKIAAPFAKWAKDKNQPTINSKQAEIAAALKDRAGRNDNSIAVELGLKTQENVEKRRQQVLRNQARMAAAKAAAAKAKE